MKTKVVINVQISEDENMLRLAAKTFLNLNSKKIANILSKILQGVINETLRNQTVFGICKNWTSVEQNMRDKAAYITANLGIRVLSCHLLKISTPDGIIENMATISNSKIEKEKYLATADISIARANAKIEDAIANVNALNAQAETAIYAIELSEKINTFAASAKRETAIAELDAKLGNLTADVNRLIMKTEMIKERKELETPEIDTGEAVTENSTESTASLQKYEATIDHIGEMIRTDFEED